MKVQPDRMHRRGALTGYGGGLRAKTWLLLHEGVLLV
ncbi:MAG: MGMT family protein [Deltaproteobacteria bacterium]|nr:MGMT family protein [Deltaproteobacteria bacterium]